MSERRLKVKAVKVLLIVFFIGVSMIGCGCESPHDKSQLDQKPYNWREFIVPYVVALPLLAIAYYFLVYSRIRQSQASLIKSRLLIILPILCTVLVGCDGCQETPLNWRDWMHMCLWLVIFGITTGLAFHRSSLWQSGGDSSLAWLAKAER